jgi:hypothetical protein
MRLIDLNSASPGGGARHSGVAQASIARSERNARAGYCSIVIGARSKRSLRGNKTNIFNYLVHSRVGSAIVI